MFTFQSLMQFFHCVLQLKLVLNGSVPTILTFQNIVDLWKRDPLNTSEMKMMSPKIVHWSYSTRSKTHLFAKHCGGIYRTSISYRVVENGCLWEGRCDSCDHAWGITQQLLEPAVTTSLGSSFRSIHALFPFNIRTPKHPNLLIFLHVCHVLVKLVKYAVLRCTLLYSGV